MTWNVTKETKFILNHKRGKEWGEIVEIYRKNNVDKLGEEQNILEE